MSPFEYTIKAKVNIKESYYTVPRR